MPESAPLHHALGLTLVRLKRPDEALAQLHKAAVLEPADARFVYVYAVALHSTGRVKQAIATLEKALRVQPEDRDTLRALVAFHQATDRAKAAKYAKRLRALDEEMARAQ